MDCPQPCRGLILALLCWAPTALLAETLLVLNKGEATASLIDLETGSERVRLSTDGGPHEVAVSDDGRYAVVTNYGGRARGHSLSVVDIISGTVVRTLSTDPYSMPHGIAFVDADTFIVTLEADRVVQLIDLDGTRGATFRTGQSGSHMVTLSPDRRRAFIANIGSGSITAQDLSGGTAISVPTGAGAEGIAVTPAGDEVWVTNREDDTVSVLDASSLEVVNTIPVYGFPIRIQFAPDGSYAAVSSYRDGSLAIIDAASQRVTRTVELPGDGPIGVLFHPDGGSLFVALTRDDRVLRLSTDDWSVIETYAVGSTPDGLGYSSR